MVVLVIHLGGISALKCKCDAPIPAYAYRPPALVFARELMPVPAWKIRIARLDRSVKPTQLKVQPLCMLRLDPGLTFRAEKSLEAIVPEAANRHGVLYRVAIQMSRCRVADARGAVCSSARLPLNV
jgi:hypothetical protein